MTNNDISADKQPNQGVSRRGLLLGAGGIVGGGLVGAAAGYSVASTAATAAPGDLQQPVDVTPGVANTQVTVSHPYGTDTIPFYGPRQAGVVPRSRPTGSILG